MSINWFEINEIYTDYKLENGKIILINKKNRYTLPSEFVYFTKGRETYYKRYYKQGAWYEDIQEITEEVYLPPGLYQCEVRKIPQEIPYSNKGGSRTVYVDSAYLLAELKVEKETYKVEVKGSYIATVGSNKKDSYPENGVKDGYWYELIK